MSAARPRRAGRRVARAIPWMLVLALLVLIASAVFKLATNERRSGYAPPVVADPDQPVEAFGGEARRTSDGAHVTYQLTRLYADPSRQAFESKSLREHFSLSEGEPWRLSVRYDGPVSAQARNERALGVADERGAALIDLELLSDASPALAKIPADPVRTAFGAWTSGDRSLRTSVLWGRRPGDGARTAWIAADGAITEATELDRASLALASVHRSELEVPLARLERPAEGKKSESRPSVGAGEGPPVEKR